MKLSPNIDLLLTIEPHYWSVARIFIGSELLEYGVTHALTDPYSDAIDALLSLNKGNQSSFYWLNDLFGIKVELKIIRGNDFITVAIYELTKVFYEKTEERDLIFTKSFEINLKQLLILFYYQFKKISVLLENEEYAMNRSKSFPLEKFLQFETVIRKKYKEIL